MYKQVVRSVLADSHKVTVDTKKMLKKLRQDNRISEHEHDQCLGQVRVSKKLEKHCVRFWLAC